MGKRIVLTTVGSFGDLHPFIAIGLALKARGFDPIIAASEAYRSKIESEGLAFHAVRPTAEQFLADTGLDKGQILQKSAKGTAAFVIQKMVVPYAEQTFSDLYEVMRGADLVVASSFSIIARLVVAKRELPSVSVLLYPCAFPSAEEPPYLMEFPWLPAVRRTLGAWAVKIMLDLGMAELRWHTRSIRRYRRQLGLPPVRGDEVINEPLRADWVVALYSPCLGPLPSDAPKNSTIAGFVFYDSEAGGPVSVARPLADFLAGGPAPLVFTLGSIVIHAGGGFYERAAEAARRLGMRAVLLVGAEAQPELQRLGASDIFVAGYAPHSLVFPRAAAIIHHGGIGTVGQALRAGRPQLICPFLGDQGDNAERLVRLGVARRLDLKRFSTDRAMAELKELLADGPTAKAATLAPQVASEDGSKVVASGIERMFADTV